MRRILCLVAMALVVAGCSRGTVEYIAEEWRNGPMPTCDTTSRGRLLLMAQSVPDAAFVPCIHHFPPGWELKHADSRAGESTLVLSTDTYDEEVEVMLATACDVAGSVELDSPRPGTALFVDAAETSWAYLFAGGCITFEYPSGRLARSTAGEELMEAIRFMPRRVLSSLSGWTL